MDKRHSIFYSFILIFFFTFGLILSGYSQKTDDVFPTKPEPAVFVHDYSGWLQKGQKAKLEQDLRNYYDSTSTQIVLMIRPGVGDYDLSSYAFELGERWGVGRKGVDNGLVIVVSTENPGRGIFIATGYGLEEFLTDALNKRIIETIILPNFRQGNYYQGLEQGLSTIRQVLSGQFQGIPQQPKKAPVNWVLVLIIIIILTKVIGSNSGRMMTGKGSYGTGFPMGRPRGYYGGGGFGGGFGRSGGGGFGGSFGGGSFGGGGAGGSW